MSVTPLFANEYRVESTRLKGWDYSYPGWYFVTICAKDKICCFGKIVKEEMLLSKIGQTVQKCWLQIPNHFDHIFLDEFTVMPNHIHGIVVVSDKQPSKCRDGACPVSTRNSNTLGDVIGSFKSTVTRWCRKNNFDFTWQSRFYDHIIRNEKSLYQIRRYIRYNPQNWDKDEENPKNFCQK